MGGEPASLTATEHDFLRALALDAGRVLTHDTLVNRVRNGRNGATANLVRVLARSLRQVLGDDAAGPT